MNTTTITKLSMNQLNAKRLISYLLNNDIRLSGNVLITMLGSINMYKNIIDNYVEENSTVIIVDTKLVNYYIKNITDKNIEIKCINVKENDINDFNLKLNNMPKFDYIIQNPPYNKSLHLDFLKTGYNMLSDNGKMIIIEPSTFYINLRKTGKAKKYDEIKELIKGHVSKVILENYCSNFNVGLYVPFAITYIDKEKIYNTINVNICGEQKNISSLYDINLIGNYNLIWSIFNKINCDKVKNHLYIPNKSNKIINNYYIPFSVLCAGSPIALYFVRPIMALNDFKFNKTKFGEYYKYWLLTLFHNSYEISEYVPKSFARGGSTTNSKKYSDNEAACITGTKEELENWKYFVFNNSLPLFINICMTIDQHNNSLDYVPWLVDKKYADQEIYEMFGFTDEEIKLIETTIKKYERYSPWFKRYMCGPSSVSDEEVQKYIESINA